MTTIKDLNFYKYYCDETRFSHFWETETRTTREIAEKIREDLKSTFPSSNITLIELQHKLYTINFKLYSDEDNALFCLMLGK
jgi:hypothetical protein